MGVSEVTSSSITVQWGAVPCIHRNGEITGYSVQYGVGSESTQTMFVSGVSTTKTTIPNLMSNTSYWIKVAAVNSEGIGNFSEIFLNQTLIEGKSSTITNIKYLKYFVTVVKTTTSVSPLGAVAGAVIAIVIVVVIITIILILLIRYCNMLVNIGLECSWFPGGEEEEVNQ